ncbi:hypothetical protein MPSEU_000010800 [Mayamaea pseudoterrestris]|nr:hypothetical protein MPSEU_000010800 [Mayamaea pseudoterrestris]
MPNLATSSPFRNNISNISALTNHGDDDEMNPWEIAAHLSMERHSEETLRRMPPAPIEDEATCTESMQGMLQRFFIILDTLVCFMIAIWTGIILWHDHFDKSNNLPKSVLILQGFFIGILLLRIFLVRGNLVCSVALASLLSGMSFFSWVEHGVVNHYLERHHWLRLAWLQSHNDKLPVILLGGALWELLIRFMLQKCILAAPYEDGNDYTNDSLTLRRRPWWWDRQQQPRASSNSHMRRPLLHDQGLPDWVANGRRLRREQQSSRWFRLPWRGNHVAATNDHVRDDGSVDFASVQEEWASRSEDDPHWWTKEQEEEEENNRLRQQQQQLPAVINGRKTGEQVDTSWLHDEP